MGELDENRSGWQRGESEEEETVKMQTNKKNNNKGNETVTNRQ